MSKHEHRFLFFYNQDRIMAGLGHLGFGLAAKKFIPNTPLWFLLLMSEFLDILSIIFMYTSVDQGFSHGMVMAVTWSVLSGFAAAYLSRDRRVGYVIGGLVFSHWGLDYLAWPMTYIFPDSIGLPILLEDSQLIGLGLGGTLIGVVLLELGPILVGSLLYFQAMRASLESAKK